MVGDITEARTCHQVIGWKHEMIDDWLEVFTSPVPHEQSLKGLASNGQLSSQTETNYKDWVLTAVFMLCLCLVRPENMRTVSVRFTVCLQKMSYDP